MRWYQIPLPRIAQPNTGTYKDWKPLLATEAKCQCVYCAIAEAAWGGYRNFHVEHYRPKSRFEELENKIENLYYACSVCNAFKKDDWPGEPTAALDTPAYPSPCDIDYNTQFRVGTDGLVDGQTVAANYVVQRLYLNRPQLILERREAAADARIDSAQESLTPIIKRATEGEITIPGNILLQVSAALNDILTLKQQKRHIRPYLPEQLERSARRSG